MVSKHFLIFKCFYIIALNNMLYLSFNQKKKNKKISLNFIKSVLIVMMFFENNNSVNNNKFIANSFDQKQIGAIDPNCDVIDVIEDAFNNAKFLCDQYYLCSPDFELVTKNGNYIH